MEEDDYEDDDDDTLFCLFSLLENLCCELITYIKSQQEGLSSSSTIKAVQSRSSHFSLMKYPLLKVKPVQFDTISSRQYSGSVSRIIKKRSPYKISLDLRNSRRNHQ
jgi:hypothetical protein